MPLLTDRKSCDESIKLDTKLFAHIHSDSRLVGTHLEGNHFLNTAGYVQKVLNYILDKKNNTGISEQTRKEIETTLEKTNTLFKLLIENETTIENYINGLNAQMSYTEYAKVEQELHTMAVRMVSQLDKHGETLLPGGWAGKPSGHAMAYKLVKETDGSITVLVYNTGSGIDNHLSKTTSKDKFLPIDAYKIPAGVNRDDLANYVQGLITPQITPRLQRVDPYKYVGDWNKDVKYDAERVYENIKKVAFLGGKKIDAQKYLKHFTQGQLSGTCSMRVLMPILQENMKGMAFKQTLYQFRLQSILDYYRNRKNDRTLGNPEVQRQLRAALDKFAVTTHKYLLRGKTPVITNAQAEESLEMINTIRKDLDANVKLVMTTPGESEYTALYQSLALGLQQRTEKTADLSKKSQDPTFLFRGGPALSIEIKEQKEKDEQQRTIPDIKIFESPIEFLQSCKEVMEDNARQFYTDAVIDNVEKMMLAIPITSPEAEKFWRKLSIRDTKEALNTIQSVMRIYGKHCYLKGGYPLPQRWLTAASSMFIAGQIANVHFGNDPKFQHLAGFIEDAVRNKELTKDPYSVSRDPKFDNRLKELKANWANIKSIARYKSGGSADTENYDLELIEKHNLVKILADVEPNKEVQSGYDAQDKARIQLYRIAQGKVKGFEERIGEPLDNLEFCSQFNEFCQECGMFEIGGFDYFNSVSQKTEMTREQRLAKIKYKPQEDRYINNSHKSNFEYSNGVQVRSTYTSDLRDVYNVEDPIIKDELFAKKYEYSSTFSGEEYAREVDGDYNFPSNRALLHFNNLAKDLDKEKYPDYPAKALPFTRVNQTTRAATTVDFFESNLDYLNDKDKQNLCLLNVLTPEVFISQVERVPGMADKWIDLVEKGLKYHVRGNKIASGGFFSLTLSFYLLKYLNSTKDPYQFRDQLQRLQKLNKFILENIAVHEKVLSTPQINQADKEVSASARKDLELLHFLRNSQTLPYQERWGTAEIKSVIRGIFCRSNLATKRGQVLDPFMDNELDDATIKLQPLLSKHIGLLEQKARGEIITDVINEFLVPKVIPDQNYKISGKYPIITVEHEKGPFIVDLGRGTVKTANYLYKTIPTEFYTQDFIQFFGDREFQGKIISSSSLRMCEITADGRDYRLILDDKGMLHIQTRLGPENKWHELQNKKDLRGDTEDLISKTNKMIPRQFLESGRYIWGEIGVLPSQYFVTDKLGNYYAAIQRRAPTEQEKREIREKTENPYMEASINEKKFKLLADNLVRIQELTPSGEKTNYQLAMVAANIDEQPLLKKLADFEDVNFMEVWQAEQKGRAEKLMKVSLPRYGLQFEVETIAGVSKLKTAQYPNYHVVTETVNSIYNMPNILYLEHDVTKERVALVPRLAFRPIDKDTKDGEYYYLKLDTDHSIAAKSLENVSPGDWHWKFSNAESFAVFKLDENNQLKAGSQEDWLHLAYLHLAKHEPAKAMNALTQCQKLGGLKGTATEMEWIKKILSEIPDPTYDDKLYEKAKTNEPETLAVRLRAAALLADFKNVSLDTPKFDLSLPRGLTKYENYNQRYQDLKKQQLIQFYTQDFQGISQQIYADYYKVMGNIPEELVVPHTHELSFLRQAFKNIPGEKAFGFVQGRWRELELVQLRQEQVILAKKRKQQGDKLSAIDEKRLKHITEILERGNPYSVGIQKLSEQTLTLNPTVPKLEPAQLSLLCNQNISTYKLEHIYMPRELHVGINYNNFLFSFESLYKLAKEPESKTNHEQKQILKRFVDNMINVWAQTNGPKPVADLCILLKYVLEMPMKWPDFQPKTAAEALSILENIAATAKDSAAKRGLMKVVTNDFQSEVVPKRASIKRFEKRKAKVTGDSVKIDISSPPLQNILGKKPESILANELGIPSISEHYQQIVSADAKILAENPEVFKKGQFEDHFLIEEVKKFTEDYQEGVRLNTLINDKRQIAKKCFKNLSARENLKTSLKSSSLKLQDKIKIQEKALEKLANKALLRESRDLKVAADVRSSITEVKQADEIATRLQVAMGKKPLEMGQLITLYLQGDLEQFKKQTKLDDKDIAELYQSLHQYLLEATALKHQKRVIKKLDKLGNKDESDPDYESAINELGEELFTKRSFEPSQNPEMLVFEFLDDKFIRDPQRKMIFDLLKKEGDGFTNKIIQMIMGGGKSKVIMPLLALRKADGTNLSMIIVPSALYETNVSDLQAVSQRLFGQQAYEFRFTREKMLNSGDLKARYKKMWQVVSDRGYMISTPESIQSLELRYLELLDTPPTPAKDTDPQETKDAVKAATEEWTLQLKYLEKMLKLIKNRGDALIDEVDSNLDPKKELNFTIGGEGEVPEIYLNMIVGLYNLLPDVVVDTPNGSILLEDILQGRREISDTKIWGEAIELVARQLIEHPKSPLFDIVANLSPERRRTLEDYLLDREKTVPAFIRALDEKTRNRIGLMKAEIQILPVTLQKKKDENYGFAKDPKAGVSMDIAIPYIANNVPNHRSQFGSYIETINFTLQLHRRNEKISPSVLKAFISDFYNKANNEVTMSLGSMLFTETESYREFHKLTGLDLNMFDPQNESQLAHLRDELSKNTPKNKDVVDYCLTHYVLKKIKQHRYILRSDAVNHISQYRSAQGMTGTPWNYRCFHKNLTFDRNETLGVDGQTMHHLLRKHTAVRKCKETSPQQIIANLFDNPQKIDILRAFIDIGALFHGINNEEVARLLAAEIKKQKGNEMRHVLYFNEDNILCAMPIQDKASPIVIGSSDPEVINAKTGSTPQQRFTYFDQHHTTGTDILQMPNALAYATIDNKTLARDFWQGVMRMRGLNSTQNIEVLLPPSVTETEDPNKVWNIKDVSRFVLNNQFNKLAELHYQGAIQNMHDIIRQHFLSLIYFQKTPEEKAALYQKFNEIFLMKGVEDPFVQFGEIEKFDSSKIVFEELTTEFYNRWKALLTKPPKPVMSSTSQEETIKKSLKEVADRAIASCKDQVRKVEKLKHGSTVEVQKEKEKEKEKLKELLQIASGSVAPIKPVTHKPWSIGQLSYLNDITRDGNIKVFPLNAMIATTEPKPSWQFDDTVLVSENFMNGYDTQKNKLDAFTKPVNFYMLIQDPPPSSKLKAMLITQEEAVELARSIDSDKNSLQRTKKNYWIASPHDSVFYGTQPELPKSHPDFLKLKEQICFFNADLDVLVESAAHVKWLQRNNQEKMEYLQTHILPNHPGKQKTIQPLIRAFSHSSIINAVLHAVRAKDGTALKLALDNVNEIKVAREREKIVNARTTEGYTVLGYAIKMGDKNIVNALLALKETDPILPDAEGRIPLAVVVEQKNKALLDIMLATDKFFPPPANTDAWNVLLLTALKVGSQELLKPWLDKVQSFKPEFQKEIKSKLLFHLIQSGQVDTIKQMIATGNLDLTARGPSGHTPFEAAIMQQNERMIKLFMEMPSAYPYKDEDNWILFLNKLATLKDEKLFSNIMDRALMAGDAKFINEHLMNRMKEVQKTKNLHSFRLLVNYLSEKCRKRDANLSKIIDSWAEIFQRTLLDGDYDGMNILLSAIKALPTDLKSSLINRGARIKDTVHKWLNITVPKLKDPVYVQQGKMRIFQQLAADPDFALGDFGYDLRAWRSLLQDAVEFSDPNLVRQILSQIGKIGDESARLQIMGLGQIGMEGFGGPLRWCARVLANNPSPEILPKQQAIIHMFSGIPDIFPKLQDRANWNELLRTACEADVHCDVGRAIFSKFESIGDQNAKKAILDYRPAATMMAPTPLLLSAIENKNYALYPMLVRMGLQPSVQDISGNSMLHILFREVKNLNSLQEWLPLVADPALKVNAINQQNETPLMQLLYLTDEINQQKVSRDEKSQLFHRWFECLTAVCNRNDLDLSIKTPAGGSILDILPDLSIDAVLKGRVSELLANRMAQAPRPMIFLGSAKQASPDKVATGAQHRPPSPLMPGD